MKHRAYAPYTEYFSSGCSDETMHVRCVYFSAWILNMLCYNGVNRLEQCILGRTSFMKYSESTFVWGLCALLFVYSRLRSKHVLSKTISFCLDKLERTAQLIAKNDDCPINISPAVDVRLDSSQSQQTCIHVRNGFRIISRNGGTVPHRQ